MDNRKYVLERLINFHNNELDGIEFGVDQGRNPTDNKVISSVI